MTKDRLFLLKDLKILKNDNISEILDDFYSEIILDLEIIADNYKKSNDEKYLTQIKNITGNSLNDEQVVKLLSKEKSIFFKDLKDLFNKKKKSRINILGEEQNKILEKNFSSDNRFSWRSHLQYLEQLRQVIGLRQYGQKDPLSEFKKEAFILFEGLLAKIKNDLIKLMLNLNIVINENKEEADQKEILKEKSDHKKVGRNEKCPCGSGKKFKHCHGNI